MSNLYIIPTPIGNIKDITVRGQEILTTVKYILSEDTRVTRKLLVLLGIEFQDKTLISYFEHNERSKLNSVLDILRSGEDVALVSDAGTPLLSDPGFPLVRELRKLQEKDKENYGNINLVVLPGATSITISLILSGFPTDKFSFLGFVPRKPGDRRKLMKSIRKSSENLKATYIMFESMHRLLSTLVTMKEIFGNKFQVSLCREITKLHESVEIGNINTIIDLIQTNKLDLRGEIVVVFNLNIKDE